MLDRRLLRADPHALPHALLLRLRQGAGRERGGPVLPSLLRRGVGDGCDGEVSCCQLTGWTSSGTWSTYSDIHPGGIGEGRTGISFGLILVPVLTASTESISRTRSQCCPACPDGEAETEGMAKATLGRLGRSFTCGT